jgi:hypothetical protein
MKKISISVLIIVMTGVLALQPSSASGQRYLPGFRGAELIGGYVLGGGYYGHFGYSKYLYSRNRYGINLQYLQHNYDTEVGKVPASQFTVGLNYSYRLISDYSQSAVLALGVTGLGGFEAVNWGQKRLSNGAMLNNSSSTIYGAEMLLEFEYYLDDRYVVLVTVKERAMGGSTVNIFQTVFGVGIKYILE